jgi:hypothetical protein
VEPTVLSALENVRESLRLALEELGKNLESKPEFWQEYWERYEESKVDYKSSERVLKDKLKQGGREGYRLMEWLQANQAQGLWQSEASKRLHWGGVQHQTLDPTDPARPHQGFISADWAQFVQDKFPKSGGVDGWKTKLTKVL